MPGRPALRLVSLTAVVLACNPTVTEHPPLTASAATIALFAPDALDACNSVLPFPTDLAKNPTTGRLDLPFCTTDTADQIALKTGLRTLDGYALGVTLTTRFSGPLDPASLPGAVKLFNAQTGAPVAIAVQQLGDADNTLAIVPVAPLAESTSYIAVVTTDAQDPKGNPVASDKVFVFAKSQEPLIDKDGYSRYSPLSDADANALEPLRLGLAPLFDALASMQLTRDKVAVAWSFTTQTVHATLPLLASVVGASPLEVTHENAIPAAAHPLIVASGIPHASLCDVHTGRVKLQSLLTPTGTFGVDAAGAPIITEAVVDYLLTTPKTGTPKACTAAWDGSKVLVFAHGLGRCKNDALALADAFAAQGFATLAFDGPSAGARSIANLGDLDLDGCPDQGATPELIALPGAQTNPFAVRDGLREWGLELSQVVGAARAGAWRFSGAAAGTGAAKVALVGHSWGGMAATLAASVATVDALAVNAASAELGAVFAPSIEELTAAQLEAAGVHTTTEPGKSLLASSVQEAVAAFRWAMEPGDPLYAPVGSPALVQVVSAAKANADAPLHATDTQQKLAVTLGKSYSATAETTFDDAGTPKALCDTPNASVGALLKPCIADKASQRYPLALAKTAGLQRQLVTFVVSASAGAAKLCDVDYTVACP